jgi:ribosomal-protein-alanine N-acetyltransferase
MMHHIGTETIITERLILRRFTLDDAEPLYRNWATDPDVVKFMRMKPHASLDDTRKFVESVVGKYDQPDTYRWVIVLKESGEPIGFIGLMTLSEADMTGDFGYSIGKAYWNKGYTSEALTAVLRYGLINAGYNRLEAYHSIRNMPSGKVMKNAGMTYEGRARQKYRSNAGFEDCDMYGIVREDIE